MRFEKYINEHYSCLNETDKLIVSFITKYPEKTIQMSISELAANCLVSRSAVFRFTKKIGLDGYNQLKYILRDDQVGKIWDSNKIGYLQSTTNAISETIRQFKRIDIDDIYEKFNQAKNIYIYATGWVQKIIADQLQHDFFMVGKNTSVLPAPADELGVILHKVEPDDVLIIISFNGSNYNLVEHIKQAKIRGIITVSFTSISQNKLAETADYSLYYSIINKKVPYPERDGIFFTSLFVLNDLLIMGYADYLRRNEMG